MQAFQGKNSVVRNGKKWGIIDIEENEIVPIQFKYISGFNNDDVALARKGKSWGAIDATGKTVIDFEYEYDLEYLSLMQLTDGYLWLKKDNLWGTIDLKNNTIIPFLYSQIQSIDGNETTVIENGEVKIIDTFGNCVKDCPEDEPKVFYDFEN